MPAEILAEKETHQRRKQEMISKTTKKPPAISQAAVFLCIKNKVQPTVASFPRKIGGNAGQKYDNMTQKFK